MSTARLWADFTRRLQTLTNRVTALEETPPGEAATASWGAITGTLSDQTDLQSALNGKQAAGSYAAATHTHVIGDVTGLQTALDGKSDTSHTHLAATTSVAGFMSAADKTKLDGVASGATANATDAALRDRSTHTGTQAASTISDFNSAARAQTEAALVAGTNITITPAGSGATRTLTIAASGGGGGSTNRMGFNSMRPAAGVFMSNSTDCGALGTQAQVANRTVCAPFVSPYDIVIDQLGVSVSTLLAGANCKVVIYNSDSNGRPSTVLIESGNISAAATGTVFATISSTTLVAGTKYWFGVRSSGTQTLRTLNVSALPVLSYTSAATPVAQQTLILTETFANAAATWTYASGQHSNALMPLVLMRAA